MESINQENQFEFQIMKFFTVFIVLVSLFGIIYADIESESNVIKIVGHIESHELIGTVPIYISNDGKEDYNEDSFQFPSVSSLWNVLKYLPI